MIPKKRFDAVNERMKRAEARLRDLEKQREAEEQVEEDQFDFDAKEEAYMEAVLDGDTKLAKELRNEIRAAEQAMYESKVSGVKDQAVEQTQIKQEFDDAVASLESASALLDPDSGDFDEALVDQIVSLQGGLLNSGQGYTPGEALLQAAQYVMGDALSLDGEAEPEPAPAPAPKPKKDVKKKVAAAQRAPADMSAGDSSSTAGEGVIDIDRLSEKEFDALPESKKRELRGDVI